MLTAIFFVAAIVAATSFACLAFSLFEMLNDNRRNDWSFFWNHDGGKWNTIVTVVSATIAILTFGYL